MECLVKELLNFISTSRDVELLSTSVEDKFVFNELEYIQSDISDRNKIKKLVYDFCPDFIINAAALQMLI